MTQTEYAKRYHEKTEIGDIFESDYGKVEIVDSTAKGYKTKFYAPKKNGYKKPVTKFFSKADITDLNGWKKQAKARSQAQGGLT